LNPWAALARFLEDGDLEIDNGATERANRDIAIGRGNGGKTAAVLRSFIASSPASAAALSRSPGSGMCFREFPRTPSPGCVNCCLTTGSRSSLLPRPESSPMPPFLVQSECVSRDAYQQVRGSHPFFGHPLKVFR
jgi:hypothetical protein